jgi:hypothetical protein
MCSSLLQTGKYICIINKNGALFIFTLLNYDASTHLGPFVARHQEVVSVFMANGIGPGWKGTPFHPGPLTDDLEE